MRNRVSKQNNCPTAIDCFAGCGGMTQGFKQAGFRVIAAIEIDPASADIYKLNQPATHVWSQDICNVAGVIPPSVAYLKHLEVIALDSIGPITSTTHDFLRIASIDSPFREQVAWAYLTTAARPGVPERDLGPWAEEIVKTAATSQS